MGTLKSQHDAKIMRAPEKKTEKAGKAQKAEKGENKKKTGRVAKGGKKMAAITQNRSLFHSNIIGFKELRNNISEVIDGVVTGYNVVISGNVKKNSTKTAAIISTKILDEILDIYRFNPVINFDAETNQFEAILNEINIYGCGDTKEEAIEITTDMVIDVTEDYFENAEMYARIPDQKAKYPYFLRVRSCSSRDEVKKVLGLE